MDRANLRMGSMLSNRWKEMTNLTKIALPHDTSSDKSQKWCNKVKTIFFFFLQKDYIFNILLCILCNIQYYSLLITCLLLLNKHNNTSVFLNIYFLTLCIETMKCFHMTDIYAGELLLLKLNMLKIK